MNISIGYHTQYSTLKELWFYTHLREYNDIAILEDNGEISAYISSILTAKGVGTGTPHFEEIKL